MSCPSKTVRRCGRATGCVTIASTTHQTSMPDPTVAYRICPLCEACCGLRVELREGRVAAVRGDREDASAPAISAPRAWRSRSCMRTRIGCARRWSSATAVSRRRAGTRLSPRSSAVCRRSSRARAGRGGARIGNPAAHRLGLLLYGTRLARALGTRNVFCASTLDQMPKHLSCGLMFGHWLSIPVPDIERRDFLLMLGANPMVSNGSLWTVPDFRGKAKALQARGGRLVVVDPRRTETAGLADGHLFIRPGGDVFLLLGMAHTLFAEKLVRLGSRAACGWRRSGARGGRSVRPRARRGPLGSRPRRFGIWRARWLAREGRSVRPDWHLHAGVRHARSWLVDVVNVLTGHLDAPGGAMFPKAAAFAANTAANTMGPPGGEKGSRSGAAGAASRARPRCSASCR